MMGKHEHYLQTMYPIIRYSDVTWASWRLKPSATRLFDTAGVKENFKLLYSGEFPLQKASNAERVSIW